MSVSVRVNRDGSLVVPPFECAWLTGTDYQLNGSACICFEAKAETDVTIILKPLPGTKRLQPLQVVPLQPQVQPRDLTGPRRSEDLGHGPVLPSGALSPSSSSGLVGTVEANYTVILGSHRNSCLKVEKNGATVCMVQGVGGSRVTAKEFARYWIDFSAKGVITIGTGEPSPATVSHQWVDPESPIPNISHVGLSCWDRHVMYRNIQVLPPCDFLLHHHSHAHGHVSRGHHGAQGHGHHSHQHMWSPGKHHHHHHGHHAEDGHDVPPLFDLCTQQLVKGLGGVVGASPCEVAQVAEVLLPTTRQLYRECLHHLATHFAEITAPAAAATATPGAVSSSQQQQGSSMNGHSSGPATEGTGSSGLSSPTGFESLPATLMCDLLLQDSITMSEKAIFDAVMRWAQVRTQPSGGWQGQVTAAGGSKATDASRTSSGQQEVTGLLQPLSPTSISRSLEAMAAADAAVKVEEVCQVLALVRYPLMRQQELREVLEEPMVASQPALVALVTEALEPLEGGTAEQPAGVHLLSLGDRASSSGISLLRLSSSSGTGAVLSPGATSGEGVTGGAGPSVQAGATASAGEGAIQGAPRSSVAPGLFSVANKRLLQRNTPSLGIGGLGSHGAGGGGSGLILLGNATRFQRRALPGACVDCSFVCDGDGNGVLRHLGTAGGSQEWVNPVLAKKVIIKASSPAGRHTDPKALAGEHFTGTNFAGPRYVNGAPDTWWSMDLGEGVSLQPSYYTLRADGSADSFPRSWVLQGSSDGTCWTDLRVHRNDVTLRKPGQYGSWPVGGPNAQVTYRWFRLKLTGPTSSSHHPHTFHLAHWEMYGLLHGVASAGGQGTGAPAAPAAASPPVSPGDCNMSGAAAGEGMGGQAGASDAAAATSVVQ